MAATAKGFPYPAPTDAFADGDLAIKALAEFLDTNNVKAIHAGTAVAAIPNGGTGANAPAIVFPAGKFSVAPVVVCCAVGTSTHFGVVVIAPTAAGCTLAARQYEAVASVGVTNVTLAYIAVQLA